MTAWATPTAAGPRPRVSRLIADLLGSRPGMGADASDRTRWLAQKADVFERVADWRAADGDVVGAAEARATARQALAQAEHLSARRVAEPPASPEPAQDRALHLSAVTTPAAVASPSAAADAARPAARDDDGDGWDAGS